VEVGNKADSSGPDLVDSSEAWDQEIFQGAEAVAVVVVADVVADVEAQSWVDDPNGRLN